MLCWKHVGVRARVGSEGVESSRRQQISPWDARGMDGAEWDARGMDGASAGRGG